MPEIGSLYVSLGLDTAQFDRALPQTVDKLKVVERSTGALRQSVQNLGFQFNDIATSLASGGSPFRVLAQQSGQIVQAFTQGGGVVPVMKEFGATIRGLVTPTTALVGGLAAVGAGFAFLVSRAAAASEEVRKFNQLSAQLGRGAGLSTSGLASSNQALRQQGVSGSLAEQQRLAVLRNPLLNASAASRFSSTGAGIGSALGIGAEGGFDRLISTIQAGPQATINFAQSLGALSAAQGRALSESAALGGGLKAQQTALAALETKYKDFAKDAMSPFEKATNNMAGAWDRFLTKLSNTKVVKDAEQAIIDMLNGISGARAPGQAAGQPTFQNSWADGARGWLGLEKQPSGAWAFPKRNFSGGGDTFTASIPPPRYVPGTWLDGNSGRGWLGGPLAGANASDAAAQERARQQILADPSGNGIPLFQTRSRGRSALGGFNFGGAGGGGLMSGVNIESQNAAAGSLAKQKQDLDRAAQGYGKLGMEAAVAAARIAAVAQAQTMFDNEADRATFVQRAVTAEVAKFNAELKTTNSLEDQRVQGERKVTEALKLGEAAAAKVAAHEQAALEVRQRGGSVAGRTGQLLASQSARNDAAIQGTANDNNRRAELIQLEAQMQGQNENAIASQVSLLQARQKLDELGVEATSEYGQNLLASVESLNKSNDLLARNREIWDQMREFGSVLEGTFGRVFDSIADGTFKAKDAIKSLIGDLAKTMASQAFRSLLFGGASSSSGTGLFGMLFSGLGLGAGTSTSATGGLGYATGGGFTVGGSGGIDSQLVSFRATPGEMVDIYHNDNGPGSGSGEVIRIDLNPSEGWVSGIADQRIVTRSGQIVQVAVSQSTKAVQRNWSGMSSEASQRQL